MEPTNLGELLRKLEVKNFEASYHFYYRLMNNLVNKPTVSGLMRLCNQLQIPYIELEKRGIFTEHQFPYDLGNPALWKLAAHVINEGSIKKDHGVHYANIDPVLHWYFERCVLEAGGSYEGPDPHRGKVLRSYADALTGRRLTFIGIQCGKKTIHQPTIDLYRMSDEVWKYYVQATLAEDGFAILGLTENKWLVMHIGWARAVDITKHVPADIISQLKPGDYNLNEIRENYLELYKIMKEHPPKLLIKEHHEFVRRHINEIPPQLWPEPRPWEVYVSKHRRVTVMWQFLVGSQQAVDLLATKYGMLPGTWKDYIFRKQYDFYLKYRGRKLTEAEPKRVHRVKENLQL